MALWPKFIAHVIAFLEHNHRHSGFEMSRLLGRISHAKKSQKNVSSTLSTSQLQNTGVSLPQIVRTINYNAKIALDTHDSIVTAPGQGQSI